MIIKISFEIISTLYLAVDTILSSISLVSNLEYHKIVWKICFDHCYYFISWL